MITLYRKHATGIGTWKIGVKADDPHTIVISHASALGGAEVIHTEYVERGLAGRTLEEQVQSRIRSRISRVKDKGYKDTYELAMQGGTNQLDLERPMLAQTWEPGMSTYVKSFLQKKLDGHRCLITRDEGKLIAYSRQGKLIPAIVHILDEMETRVQEGETFDGELYAHGVPLQTIGSWIKRYQDETRNLTFVCYDMMSKEVYEDRHRVIAERLTGLHTVRVLPIIPYQNDAHMLQELQRVRDLGFEGLMLRVSAYGYEPGKRSRQLLKVKKFMDAEFKCIDVLPSADGWGIAVCEAPGGRFNVSCPGNIPHKIMQLKEKHKYIGRMLTVEFAYYTNDKIPFQPNAIRWREDV